MKKTSFIALILASLAFACSPSTERGTENTHDLEVTDTLSQDTVHTSRNSLDWDGVYEGTLPCADCEGILTRIELKSDDTYLKTEEYLGRKSEKFSSEGKIEWASTGNTIVLVDAKGGEKQSYSIKEASIVQLDVEGKEVTGELASAYILNKK